jgi:hypothetical protein
MYTAKDRPKAVSLLNAIAVQGSGIETVQGREREQLPRWAPAAELCPAGALRRRRHELPSKSLP